MAADVDALIRDINKAMKADVLTYASEIPSFQRVTTGSLAFDLPLGGGWPLNCWNEIVGNESHGKTVMALKTLAANMADDPDYRALWVASEDFNRDWAEDLGVDLDRLVIAPINIMEDAYEIILKSLDSQSVDAVVLDSYPALIPATEGEAAMDEFAVGVGARLTNKLMRKSPPAQRRKEGERPCLGLIINQWREKIGVLFGDPRTTPGGRGKNFSFFTRVEVTRDSWIEDENKIKVGLNIKAMCMKNKTAPPMRVGQTPFYFTDHHPFRRGQYDVVTTLFNIGLTYDLITRQGAWYHYGDERWNGKAAVIQGLGENVKLRDELETEVRRLAAGLPPSPQPRKRSIKRKRNT